MTAHRAVTTNRRKVAVTLRVTGHHAERDDYTGKLAVGGLALLMLALLAAVADAGPIFFRGELRDGKFVPPAAARPASAIDTVTGSVKVFRKRYVTSYK